jgi:hypothetical protein
MGWMEMLNQLAGGAANPEHQFEQVAQQAPPDVLGKGVADAFRSEQTPPMEQMVGELFGRSNPTQQAGLLNQLLATLGPALLSGAAGGALGRVLSPGATQVTPEQASKLDPSEVEQIVNHARQVNPGIADQLGQFYANHSTLIKTLGGAVLAIALAKMKDHASQR